MTIFWRISMDKVFIDTGIAVDLLTQREPYSSSTAALFNLADKGKLTIVSDHGMVTKKKASEIKPS